MGEQPKEGPLVWAVGDWVRMAPIGAALLSRLAPGLSRHDRLRFSLQALDRDQMLVAF